MKNGKDSLVNLARFSNPDFDRGASKLKELLWLKIRSLFFLNYIFTGYKVKAEILKKFGAKLGKNVIIKPIVKIKFPWKLEVGNNSWLGENIWILNLDKVTIGANVCISQNSFLCTGNHNWKKETFDLITKPIVIKDGAWVCANVFIGPGVTVGYNTIITSGSVVTKNMPDNMICSGNPCKPVMKRIFKSEKQ
ncbi:MAG TPA: WcaF family extracellular polysaccharide biosynthesis acetyltransferase [Victivallales bacterium]|nr:WcaF family extracellular polysaccharide biosynthesis acetyltransferase [Victivallales bacterium]